MVSAELAAVLKDLGDRCEVTDERVGVLSDLDRAGLDALRGAWSTLPVEVRIAVMERAVGVFLKSIDVDFTRLGLVALDDPEPRVRLGGVVALSESETGETADRLLALANGDPNESVREAAVDGLGRFVELAQLGDFSSSAGDRIVAALRTIVADERLAEEIRSAAIEAVGASSESWVEAIISDAYYANSREIRLAAVVAMGRSADDQWLEFLFEQLHSEDPEFRLEAATACGEIGSDDGIEPLAELLVDDEPEVVFAAIAAVGEIGGPGAVAVLDSFKEDADPDFHDAVVLAREQASERRSRQIDESDGGDS